MFDQFKAILAPGGGAVTIKDLKMASQVVQPAGAYGGYFGALVEYLDHNYKDLTRGHWDFGIRGGITDKDRIAAVKNRRKEINDLDVH